MEKWERRFLPAASGVDIFNAGNTSGSGVVCS